MKRIAFAGAGSRGLGMYALPLARDFRHAAALVGVYDSNPGRAALLRDRTTPECRVFDSFDAMLGAARPDVVIVTTVDATHHLYVVRALEAGCDVILEKPMATDAAKCIEILDAERRTGRCVTVTFNLRYTPFAGRLRRLMREGAVGEVLSVHFEWMLDTRHGADYFRRWHRRKENSGGLLVHKSTHHFDLVNWLIDQDPVEVSAFGALRYYGPTRENRGKRCMTCAHRGSCELFLDVTREGLKELYLACEDADGYMRDACVFSEDIDIEDTVSLIARYDRGAQMSYSLTAHSPYEGFRLAINGTAGRLETEAFHGEIGPFAGQQVNRIRLYNRDQEEISIHMPPASGEHGGGDQRLLPDLLAPEGPDPLGRRAGTRAGAQSMLVGVAANESMRRGTTVRVKDLAAGRLG